MKNLILFILLMFVFTAFAQKAKVLIDGDITLSLEALHDTVNIFQFDEEGPRKPNGYQIVAQGRFRAGPATIKCGERYMVKKIKEKCRNIGATAFKFTEVKEPNGFFNSCYRSKVLFLIRE